MKLNVSIDINEIKQKIENIEIKQNDHEEKEISTLNIRLFIAFIILLIGILLMLKFWNQ